MKIIYNKSDELSKVFQILEGVFPLEKNKNFSWIWTSTKVSGVVSNVEYITIKAYSEIDNFLIYENERIDIKSNSLNIIKLNVIDKTEFEFRLESSFNPVNDTRELGIKIIGMLVDGEVIF